MLLDGHTGAERRALHRTADLSLLQLPLQLYLCTVHTVIRPLLFPARWVKLHAVRARRMAFCIGQQLLLEWRWRKS